MSRWGPGKQQEDMDTPAWRGDVRGKWQKLSAVGWTLDPEGIPRWIVVCQENVQITRDVWPDQVMDAEEVVGRLANVPV